MKAAQINSYGDPSVFQINPNAEEPQVADGSVLVEVHASSLNPFDTTVRSGKYKDMMPVKFPGVLGGDIAGVVAKIGKGVSELSVGDKVYGSASMFAGGSGAFAEFASTPENNLAKFPSTLNFLEAGALPLTGVSAVQALIEHINLKKNQKILIHGGAGGIGTMAIQIAKNIGAFVATTAATSDLEYVKSLGADQVIDYKTEKFEDAVKDFDAVFDTVAGETYTRSFQVLKPGGIIVSMLEQPNKELSVKFGVTAIAQQTKVNKEHLEKLNEFVVKGIKTHIEKVFALDEIKEAFVAREDGKVKGKIVLEIRK